MRRLGQFAWLMLPLIGLLVWAAFFMAAYSFIAVACALEFAKAEALGLRAISIVPFVLAAVGSALIGAAWLTLERRRAAAAQDPERLFLVGAGRVVAIVSLLAIALCTVPAALLTC